MKLNLNKTALVLALLAAARAHAAPAADGRVERTRWLMGTFCAVTAWGPDAAGAADAAFAEIDRWDRLLSLYKPASELNALNASAGTGPFKATAPFYDSIAASLALAKATGGAFDPTVLPVIRRGPEALPLVGWSKVRLDPAARTVELPIKGMGLDSGGFGKGWALDRAVEAMKAKGSPRGFLNFGGQIMAYGVPPDAAAWTVVLPGRAEPLSVRDESVSTSGDSERPGHIVSPFDGKPVRRTVSATAVLPSAMDADAWSTALFVLGKNPPSFPGRSFFVETPRNPNTGASR